MNKTLKELYGRIRKEKSKIPNGLEALDNIRDYGEWLPAYEMGIIRRELKALEIIKKKRVNLECIKCCDTYEQYKTICSYWNEITQEDFQLLKEVLK